MVDALGLGSHPAALGRRDVLAHARVYELVRDVGVNEHGDRVSP
jgi:hypothetical protein